MFDWNVGPLSFNFLIESVNGCTMAEALIKECQEAGLVQGATDYLVARGFTKLAQIANVADGMGEFMNEAFQPFKDGMEITKGEDKKVWKMAEGED